MNRKGHLDSTGPVALLCCGCGTRTSTVAAGEPSSDDGARLHKRIRLTNACHFHLIIEHRTSVCTIVSCASHGCIDQMVKTLGPATIAVLLQQSDVPLLALSRESR